MCFRPKAGLSSNVSRLSRQGNDKSSEFRLTDCPQSDHEWSRRYKKIFPSHSPPMTTMKRGGVIRGLWQHTLQILCLLSLVNGQCEFHCFTVLLLYLLLLCLCVVGSLLPSGSSLCVCGSFSRCCCYTCCCCCVCVSLVIKFVCVWQFLFSLTGETAGNSVRVHRNLHTSACSWPGWKMTVIPMNRKRLLCVVFIFGVSVTCSKI